MRDLNNKTCKLNDDLTLVAVEDSGVMLHVEKRCYYDLNVTAFFLLNLMEKGCHHEQLLRELTSEFHVDRETAQKDIDIFLKELMRLDLLSINEEKVERKSITGSGSGKKPYRSPVLEYQKDLAVACAVEALTGGVSIAN
jgi:hypothetical protein